MQVRAFERYIPLSTIAKREMIKIHTCRAKSQM